MSIESIELSNVGRRYGNHVALRRCTLTLRAGELVLLLGPNGAGKSTLLKILATLLPPSQGRLSLKLNGQKSAVDYLSWGKNRRDRIGLVSHASLLYDNLSGRENLELFATLYGVSGEPGRDVVSGLLAQVEMSEAADRLVSTYSRGMRQRLSIARALVQDPDVVLLDEPFTGLDHHGQEVLYNAISGLRDAGKIIVLITHHLELPTEAVDRVVLLHGQTVRRDEAPSGELSAWYRNALGALA